MIVQQITSLQELDICKKYIDGNTTAILSKEYGISTYRVRKILKKNNVTFRLIGSWVRKYSFDTLFFKKIDTEEKAYWLGFLYADGCVTRYSVNLGLDILDKDSIVQFKNSIKYTGPIEITKSNINYGGKYGIKKSVQIKLRVKSVEMVKDVTKLGCLPRKSLILTFPSEDIVPNNLLRHFIRGYFDGDGSVYERKYKRKDGIVRGHASFTGTDNIINGIKKTIIEQCQVNPESLSVSSHPTSRGISRMMVASFESMKRLRGFLYMGTSIYMKRKFEKFYSLNLEPVSNITEKTKIKEFILEFLNVNNIIKTKDIISIGYLKHQVHIALKELTKENKIRLVSIDKNNKSYCQK